ncbi:MAG: FMN-binding negative transcriptional regulator [Sphingobacteriales bacterium]|nr:FMN-binding negative transcriptional regulator [Sphingobacteriales bacterium]
MYSLPYFKEKDAEVVLQFMKNNPFVFLCGVDKDNKPVASQIPVFIDERDGKLFLTGHIMRNTDHQKAFEQNPNALAVFTGAHTYISASWYAEPKQASTWNYMSVHVKGVLKFLDEAQLIEVLKRTTNHFENNAHSPANFEQLPEDYVQRLIKAIVAIEIEMTEIENVFKLSQNRDEKSYHNIMHKLKEQQGDGEAIAEEMKKRFNKLF